ncbi:MAG TPA: Lrp/AsnC family transcriptional regulator [Amycolatopsis sp.]|nr:Lrp/AsnC family transcriptional regulator [Amycolatopsis sp.]
MPTSLDRLDLALLRLLVKQPRAGMREYARLLGVARGTVQARIQRLEDSGVVTGYAAAISTTALGFRVLAFVHLHLAQGNLDAVSAALAQVPEVLEAHSITGEGDLLCRVAARDNGHLERVVQVIVGLPGVVRTRTEIALNERVPPRVLPLLDGDLSG